MTENNVPQTITPPPTISTPAKSKLQPIFFIVLGLLTLIVIGELVFLSWRSMNKTKSSAISPTASIQPTQIPTPTIKLEEKYNNPFEEKNQYKNPFEESSVNPFDSLTQ